MPRFMQVFWNINTAVGMSAMSMEHAFCQINSDYYSVTQDFSS